MDISSIITTTKKDFTRQRASVIKDFLYANDNNTVILSLIKKARGDSVKFYYKKDGAIINNDIVLKNAKTLIKAFQKNNIALYVYNNGDITSYDDKTL